MEMTKQRKMLIAVLVIGLGGLALDRFVLGTPESASADAGDVPIHAAQPGPPPPAQSTAIATASPTPGGDDVEQVESLPSFASLTERLIAAQAQQQTQEQDFSDPFNVPADWSPQRVETTNQTTAVVQQVAPLQEYLLNQYRLDSTSRVATNGQDELLAVVASGQSRGRFLRVGDYVDVRYTSPTSGVGEQVERFTLVEVGNRYVVWQSTTQEPQLRIQMNMQTAELQ